jgi:hypothetical protein
MSELKYFQNLNDFLLEENTYKINPKVHAEELVMILGKSIGEVNNLYKALEVINRFNPKMVLKAKDQDTLSFEPIIHWLSNFNDNNRRKILTWFRDNKDKHKRLIRLFDMIDTLDGFIVYYNQNFTGEHKIDLFEGLQLHNIQNGKLLISWMVPNTEINSDNYYYDIGIGDRKIEVKDFTKRKTPLEEIKIQLAEKTKISRYEFWSEMDWSILQLRQIKPELIALKEELESEQWKSDENDILRKFLKYAFEVLDEQFLQDFEAGNFENTASWERMYNLFISGNNLLKFKKSKPGEGIYDYVKFISSSRDNKPMLFDVEPVEIKTDENDIPEEITLKIREKSELEKKISYLRVKILKFKYARNPVDWIRDILAAEQSIRNFAKKINILIVTQSGIKLITGQGNQNLIFNTVGNEKVKVSYLGEEPKEDLSNYKNGILSQPFMKNIWAHR